MMEFQKCMNKRHLYVLPPLILMIRLPLSIVQPRRACAAVTESTTCNPVHNLGQRPAHGVQFNLQKKTTIVSFPNNKITCILLALKHTDVVMS